MSPSSFSLRRAAQCLLLLTGLLLGCQTACGQPSLGIRYYQGAFLASAPKARYLRDGYTRFSELYYLHQTDGRKAWQCSNRLPQWGGGLLLGHTGSSAMGRLAGGISFVTLPLWRQGRFTSALRLAAGLGWIQQPYDTAAQHKNTLLGSAFNGYANFLWQQEVRLSERWSLNAGLSFSHLSNGGSRLPNAGFNVPALSLGLRYGRTTVPAVLPARPDSFDRCWQLSLLASAGRKQAPWVGSDRYVITMLALEGGRQFAYSDRLAAGLLLIHNPTLQIDPAGIPSRKRDVSKMQAGLYASYEHAFGRISVPVQLGAYILNRDLQPLLFQQVGVRYRIDRHWQAQLMLKTHLKQADLIHAGIGYTF